ncbi:MAG: PilZ domain-containing protein [Pseudomonadota bacterium]
MDKFLSRPEDPIPAESFERSENRRLKGERFPVSFPVFATYDGQLIQGFVQAVNLSWSGMLLATNFPLNVGDHVSLEFTLPGSMVPIQTNAHVVHRQDGRIPEEATELGVAFVQLEPNVQRMIAGYVLENLSTE